MKDDFESRLQSLGPRALPEAWRSDILAQAQRGARPSKRPPRWLVVGWGMAWAAVVVLHLLTPAENPGAPPVPRFAAEPAMRERAQSLNALLALNTDPNLHLP